MGIVAIKLDYYNEICYSKFPKFKVAINDKIIISFDECLYSGSIIKIFDKYDKNLEIGGSIVRIINKDDLKKIEKNNKDSEEVMNYAKKCAKDLELDMNFVDAFFSFDRNKLILDYLADTRIDFRELAKKLAAKYKTRIELCQIGVRDKAKKIGGLGPCGMFLCCNQFLTDFNSVSINMAKNQFLALNPGKINGICGRLLCCLGYENDLYTELKENLPKVGLTIETSLGKGKVVDVNVFKNTYRVDLGEKGIVEFEKDNK